MPRVTIYHNVSLIRAGMDLAPAIFARPQSGYHDGDTVAIAFAYLDDRASVTVSDVCERAFEIGNIDPEHAHDDTVRTLASQYRTELVRSVSTGDVVSVDGEAYVVASIGFERLGSAAGLTFAGGRHARDVRDLVENYELDPNRLSAADRAFIDGLIG